MFANIWNRLKSADLALVARWLYLNWRLALAIWLAVGVTLTWWFLSAVWYVGGSPAIAAGLHSGPFGPVRMTAQPAVPGLGYLLLSHWWGWLALALFTLAFSVSSPALVIALPLMLVGAVMALVFGPVGIAVGLIFLPFLLVIGAPVKVITRILEALGSADAARGLGQRLRLAIGLGGGVRRGAQGQPVVMNEADYLAYQTKKRSGGEFFIGVFCNKYIFPVSTEKHVTIVAPTRAGKGRFLIVPNLRRYPGPAFVLDPKGENCLLTIAARSHYGPVYVLDPFGITDRACARFNPLAHINGPLLVSSAQVLADALITGDENDHWAGSARELLTGLICHVVTADGIETRDLPTVRRLLARDLPATLQAMTENLAGPSVVADVGKWGLEANDKEWGSITSTAIEQMKWLNAPQMIEITSDGGNQVDFRDYLDSNIAMSVFVCLPAPYFATYARWLRMITAFAIDTLTSGRPANLPRSVRFILDELAQLGHLQKVESALTLSAGYGVQLWGIWQHIADIERCYPKSGVNGWSSCSGIRLVFNVVDNATVNYFAEASGVLSPSDLRLMPADMLLALIDGENPALVDKHTCESEDDIFGGHHLWVEPLPTQPPLDEEEPPAAQAA